MESDFIAWLREKVPADPRIELGPGDDAAVVRLAGKSRLVVTSDLLTDGVDFVLAQCDPRRVGRKAVAVNLSDLAAMAAAPLAMVVSLALPRRGADSLARQLFEGMLELAASHGLAMAGGDTNVWDGQLVISVTAMGEVTQRGPLRRDGARPGDRILVTGRFGGSILGKHFDFTPRVREALLLHSVYDLHAGIDVSDGLSKDLARIAAESGCGAALTLDAIPVAPAAMTLAQSSPAAMTALQHALSDGEDFELILSVPRESADRILDQQPLEVPITCIGEMIDQPGLWQRLDDGTLLPLPPTGWEHG